VMDEPTGVLWTLPHTPTVTNTSVELAKAARVVRRFARDDAEAGMFLAMLGLDTQVVAA
jgi:hypothetical protein